MIVWNPIAKSRSGSLYNRDTRRAVGSTLAVYPICDVVPIARRLGASVIIVNAEPTQFDDLADAVVRGSISEVLPEIIRK